MGGVLLRLLKGEVEGEVVNEVKGRCKGGVKGGNKIRVMIGKVEEYVFGVSVSLGG